MGVKLSSAEDFTKAAAGIFMLIQASILKLQPGRVSSLINV